MGTAARTGAAIQAKVGLFVPCYIDAFFPEVGIAKCAPVLGRLVSEIWRRRECLSSVKLVEDACCMAGVPLLRTVDMYADEVGYLLNGNCSFCAVAIMQASSVT